MWIWKYYGGRVYDLYSHGHIIGVLYREQDNDPKHTSRGAKELVRENKYTWWNIWQAEYLKSNK